MGPYCKVLPFPFMICYASLVDISPSPQNRKVSNAKKDMLIENVLHSEIDFVGSVWISLIDMQYERILNLPLFDIWILYLPLLLCVKGYWVHVPPASCLTWCAFRLTCLAFQARQYQRHWQRFNRFICSRAGCAFGSLVRFVLRKVSSLVRKYRSLWLKFH